VNKEDLTTWFSDQFWPAYKEMVKTPVVTKWTGGARGECLKKIYTLNPTADLRERIMHSVLEHKIHRKKLYSLLGTAQAYEEFTKYVKFYTNRDGKTWIFNLGWDDEIPELPEERAVKVASGGFEICREPGCNRPVHGPRFDQCSECLHTDPYQPERQAIGEKMYPKREGESNHDRRERIKADGQRKVAGLRAAIGGRK